MRSSTASFAVILAALLAGLAGGLLAANIWPVSAPATSVAEPGLAIMERRIDELARGQQELSDRLDRATNQPAALETSRTAEPDIAALVERYLGERERAVASSTPPAALAASAGNKQALLAQALKKLNDPALDFDQRTKIWGEYAKLGLMDELVAYYEQLAAQNPSNPDLQVAAGAAYLQKLFTVGAGPAAGEWALKADAAFDKALSLDEQHWDARFAKASSLAHWPPVFGKQAEAISHFEKLVAQQQQGPQAGDKWQTYLLLGNLYQQNGKPEKALATWNAGLLAFPGNGELQKQIQLNSGG